MNAISKATGLTVVILCGLVLLACDLTIATQSNQPSSSSSAQPPPPPGQPSPGEPPIGQPPPGGQPGAPQVIFSADRPNLNAGECATLSWNAQGQVFGADLDGQRVNLVGQQQVCPKESTLYVLSVDAGTAVIRREMAITVQVGGGQPPPLTPSTSSSSAASTSSSALPVGCPGTPVFTSPFTANPSAILPGQSSTLSWGNVTNGTTGPLVGSLKLEPGFGEVGAGASHRAVKPNQTTTYTLIATGCGGTVTKQVTVVVSGTSITPLPVISVDLAITDIYPQNLPKGEVYVRITNNGPDSVTNLKLTLLCTADKTNNATGVKTNVAKDYPSSITLNLKPGQTQTFATNVLVDTTTDWYAFECQLAYAFDSKPGNNKYSERIPPAATLPPVQIVILDLAIDDIYPEATGRISIRLKNLGNSDITNASVPMNCSAKVTYVANPNSQATMTLPPVNRTVNLKVNQTVVFDTGFARNPTIQAMWVTCTISPALVGDNTGNNSLTKQVK